MSNWKTSGLSKGEAYDRSADAPVNVPAAPTLGEIISRRYGRREILQGALAVTAIGALLGPPLATARRTEAGGAAAPFDFAEIAHGVDERHHVAPGYDADILIRWGDPLVPGAPAFDPMRQTPAAQERQFGYNNDYIAFISLPPGSNNPDSGLLCVNHEYTDEELMFPGLGGEQDAKEVAFAGMTRELVEIEMAAHGASIVEVRRDAGGQWRVVPDSRYNRRISALSTEMRISGPAAGHARLKTKADPTGTRVIGMLNNCAGGVTPWGTYLSAEENVHGYFWAEPEGGDEPDDLRGHPEERNFRRYGIPGRWYAWGRFHDRFDVRKEPNEANRFGWIVEIDPLDPTSTPVKRTALGRFKHEGAETIVNRDGRVVLYSGDDERFEYVYKFVTDGRFDPQNRAANRDLLDSGTLFVARFNADGTLDWLPLRHGEGPLTAANGFTSQADILIEARRAADLLGATPMDRPEDVQPNPVTGKLYVMLTNNAARKPEQRDAANPRAHNAFGHIIEILPADGDHAAATAHWEILVRCGDPAKPDIGARWNPGTSPDGWFVSPDNCAVDAKGRLWVATDQGGAWPKSGTADGIWALATEGEQRGLGRMFFRAPVGAELCGPCFTPDGRTLFVSVQHPAADGAKDYAPFGRRSTFEDPATRWPDFDPGMPPRPAVVVITRRDGGVIGG